MPFKRTRPEKRIGWIIGDQLDRPRLGRRINVHIGGISLTRYNWITARINATPEYQLKYELYRFWKRYDALLFLKSMGPKSMDLIDAYQGNGRPIFFDANVNYYQIQGREYFRGMLPTDRQREEAILITAAADGVIADSEFLKKVCDPYNPRVCWVPDNVCFDLVPLFQPWTFPGDKLPLLWSGEAVKLFEILAVEDVFRKFSRRIELVLVTNDLAAWERWAPDTKARFQALLRVIPHQIIPYQSIEHLFQVYSRGGVIISPRFLDNSYNWGHTEWKIALGMACGRMALASPVPSYTTVAERAGGKGIRICHTAADWERNLAELLDPNFDWEPEEIQARQVVEKYYATEKVAKTHAAFVNKIVKGKS
jgi:hypothetical protein